MTATRRGMKISRRAVLKLALSATALTMLDALQPGAPFRPAAASAAAPDAGTANQQVTVIEVIGPRSPFQPFEFDATDLQGGFPILGSELLADSDIEIDLAFSVDWLKSASQGSYAGIQIMAGPDENSPQRPALLVNLRRSDSQLILGHRHAGRVDAVGIGGFGAGRVECQLSIAVDGQSVRVTTPSGSREMTLTESLYALGRELRVYTGAGNAIERISRFTLSKATPRYSVDPVPTGPSLRDLAPSHAMSIGAVPNLWRQSYDARYEALARTQFNHVAVDGELIWRRLRPTRDSYFFAWADAVLNFATSNGIDAIAGHLLWHADFGRGLPDWLTSASFSRDETISIIREHITAVMNHYRGKVSRWSVVNEGMSPDGFWPRDPFSQRIGPDYVDLAFQMAREADPNVELIYNETNAVGNKKADRVFELVKRLKGAGLIDGVGMQMHVKIPGATGPNWTEVAPSQDVLLAEMSRIRDLGLSVEITELDVNVFGAPISVEEKLQRQARVYADVLSAALKSGACRRFTMHGFVDPFSWLLARDDLKVVSEAPCIFDGDYQPKPAFFALRETLAGS